MVCLFSGPVYLKSENALGDQSADATRLCPSDKRIKLAIAYGA
jgi:hypothetical protein